MPVRKGLMFAFNFIVNMSSREGGPFDILMISSQLFGLLGEMAHEDGNLGENEISK